MLATEVARRVEGVDYRALAAASMLGLGSIWAQGLSGSAALQMATPGALQPQIRDIVAAGGLVPGGMIPFTAHDLPLAEPRCRSSIEIVVVVRGDVAGDAAGEQGEDRGGAWHRPGRRRSSPRPGRSPQDPIPPGAWLEHSPLLNLLIVAMGAIYLVRYFVARRSRSTRSRSTSSTSSFLIVGVLLHRTPARLMHAVQAATPAVWGVILQFPFYAGIAAIITTTHLNERLANAFVSISSPGSFPGRRRDLFSGAGRVRAVGRIEVGDRGAVRDGRRRTS